MKIPISSILIVLILTGFSFAPQITRSQTLAQTSAPTNLWSAIASSADGAKLFACAGGVFLFSAQPRPIYTSTNGGVDWMSTSAPSDYWSSIAASADGTKVVAAVGTTSVSGGIYTSADGGLTWISNNVPPKQWRSVASSADGSKLFVVSVFGLLCVSTNSGATWSTNAAPNGAWTIACSADGSKVIAAPGNSGGRICLSTNSGLSWTTNSTVSSRIWWSVASSADGKILAAVDGMGGPTAHIFTSTDSGMTWATNNVPLLSWQNVGISADGTKLIAAAWIGSGAPNGPVYTSTNSGVAWVSNSIPIMIWEGVTCTADGCKFIAVNAGTNSTKPGTGGIWIAQNTPSPQMKAVSASTNLLLSWIISTTNFDLQQSADLSSWVTVTNSPDLNLTNLQNEVSLPISSDRLFFRLKTP